MKTIQEIFIKNPSLLDTPEVKELCEQFKYQFDTMKNKYSEKLDMASSVIMNSELFVINGTPCKEVVGILTDVIL